VRRGCEGTLRRGQEVTRFWLRALQAVAVVGLLLALLGFVIEGAARTGRVINGDVTFRGSTPVAMDATLYILDGAKQAGEPLLLSALLLVACEIALRIPYRLRPSMTDHT